MLINISIQLSTRTLVQYFSTSMYQIFFTGIAHAISGLNMNLTCLKTSTACKYSLVYWIRNSQACEYTMVWKKPYNFKTGVEYHRLLSYTVPLNTNVHKQGDARNNEGRKHFVTVLEGHKPRQGETSFPLCMYFQCTQSLVHKVSMLTACQGLGSNAHLALP